MKNGNVSGARLGWVHKNHYFTGQRTPNKNGYDQVL
jgi:hypothetical protein